MSGLSSASRRRLIERLDQHDCEALIVLASSSADPDLAGFVGRAHLGESCVIATRSGRVAIAYSTPMEREEAAVTGLELLPPEPQPPPRDNAPASSTMQWVESGVLILLRDSLQPGARVAMAGSPNASSCLELLGLLRDSKWEVVGGSRLLKQWRRSKQGWQIQDIRLAAEGTCDAMRRVARLLAASREREGALWRGASPVRVSDLNREVSEAFAVRRLQEPEGHIIALGSTAGVPHSRSAPESIVRTGETIVVDLFPRAKLFADCTRTFVVGTVNDEVREAYDTVRGALEAAEASVQAGVLGSLLQAQACDFIEQRGYSTRRSSPTSTTGYVHGLGHGVGFELHELPSFRGGGEDGTLEEGDVLTIEPGLYNPAAGYGIRLEDLLWLGPDGPENLTPLPYDMNPASWATEGSKG